MPPRKPLDAKAEALRRSGCLNARPQTVRDDIYRGNEFFDPRDLVQVKYEMLRRARVDGESIATCAAAFGFSRPTFYQAQAAFEGQGLPGLISRKPGPRRAHKLSEQVVDFLEGLLADNSELRTAELVAAIQRRFGLEVHARSVERALERRKKKRR
jgi:transposase